ncbi:UDP-N-acetylmuramoyl-L-alanyl-D-glutamate--2,6-diaminopimelate ligase [Corynebacterium aquilae]|uniref:UDP-N-acetylmuramoyl-L-alanyl-D-glutamate--2,6-diaminopimelate ligase n=1 Tax=Corynebacterium aquilae DSM 44791 TaxID=1431546 RepID=A0A1L7CH71_9CORY|nr:UDP-N-acetylmuramoyl-L-alanyl-D-glutamate--2,6-diaminopimelate ligase [Corynebacterium aquilae]APT85093.1 UDP-N-acetylmuramoyl-L-alanyl-D-glutamate--2,6-diaminopimelate ligase [Corynebacterium aquilae DSM 44791]
MSITLEHLAEVAGGRIVHPAELTVAGISINAQACGQQDVFAAVPGTRAHGAEYAADSAAGVIITDADGAAILQAAGDTRPLVVVDNVRRVLGPTSSELYGNPSHKLTIIGMTGTSGKTTTSYLVEAALMKAGHSVGLIGTTGTRINGEPIPTSLTTPEAPTLQQLFATMVDKGVTHVVMEVSSHAITLGRVAGTRFAVKGFSNLSQDHLDFHHSMQEYYEAKAQWFTDLNDDCRAVVVLADQWGARLAEEHADFADAVDVNAGIDAPARFVVRDAIPTEGGGHSFTFVDEKTGKQTVVTLPLPGRFNVANAALALGMLAEVGEDLHSCANALRELAVPGRMERVDVGQRFIAVVDYAHKPAAIAAVLETLRGQVPGRIGIVVGAGGDRDAGKRPIMGAEAVKGADFVVITDDNPRSEDPELIRDAVEEGAHAARRELDREVDVVVIGDRARAIDAVVNWAQPGDAIVVAGKGHETGQLINGVTHPFDDRVELRRSLMQRAQRGRL